MAQTIIAKKKKKYTYELEGGAFQLSKSFGKDDTLKSPNLGGFRVALKKVF